ncbi:MAG TPA: efflux RND transporter periplasmic adaptor subunit [Clostridia bacterium]|nr:efflux RND transporter periplasmic adaptor subunit [Clostridia bacterium]
MRIKIAGPAILVLCIAAAAALFGCGKKETEKEPVVTVQTAVAQKTSLEQVVTTEAVLYPKSQAAITPKVASPVRRYFVTRGTRVRKGQLLAILENRDIAAAVTENKGALEQAQAAFETTTRATLPEDLNKAELDARAARESYSAQQKLYDSRQELFKQGALPRKDIDQAGVALVQARAQSEVAEQHLASMHAVGKQQAAKSAAGQLASAQGKYQGAAAQLSYTEIRSPIDGVVTDRPNYNGEMPAQGTALLTLMDTSTVIARAHIPQDQVAMLRPGDAATISTSAGETPAKVTVVSPALDPGSTTVEVWIEAANKASALRPGSTVQVRIKARTIENAITIPASALLKTPEGTMTVMVVGKDSRAHQTEVEAGVRSGEILQIVKGLNAGETVVTTGAYGLPDNTQVKSEATGQQANIGTPAGEKD